MPNPSVHNEAINCFIADYLTYNSVTGVIFWNASKSKSTKAGDIAGSVLKSGYRTIGILGKSVKAHRLAWFIHYGYWPTKQIDHINGNKDDNRISNLREATRTENNRNSVKPITNKTGYKGVCWVDRRGKYQAQIRDGGKSIFLGYFDCPEEAHSAYCDAAKKLHKEFANDGL